MNNIFFDLDGTLVNSQIRLYNLFCLLCPENKFTYDEYWNIKRQHITQQNFLRTYFAYNDDKIARFRKKWFELVENDNNISEDILVDGMYEILEAFSKTNNLYVITHRQKKELAIKELKILNIGNFFKKVLVTEQKTSKVDLIRQNVAITKNDYIIGDTGEDISTAHDLGLKSIAVVWGVMNKSILEKYSPDFIAEKVGDLYKLGII